MKKFPAICGTQRFIIMFTRKQPFFPVLTQLNPVHTLLSPSLCKMYLVLCKWSLLFMFSNEIFCSFLLVIRAPHIKPLMRSINFDSSHFAIFSSSISIVPSPVCILSVVHQSQILSIWVLPLMGESMFDTSTR